MKTRKLTAMDREAFYSDYFVFKITPIRMSVEDVDELTQKIESTINLFLKRDACRVEARVRQEL